MDRTLLEKMTPEERAEWEQMPHAIRVPWEYQFILKNMSDAERDRWENPAKYMTPDELKEWGKTLYGGAGPIAGPRLEARRLADKAIWEERWKEIDERVKAARAAKAKK